MPGDARERFRGASRLSRGGPEIVCAKDFCRVRESACCGGIDALRGGGHDGDELFELSDGFLTGHASLFEPLRDCFEPVQWRSERFGQEASQLLRGN